MNVLLVYPEIPETFWSFKHALRFASRRAAFPPLGLLTVAGMLPHEWGKRLVDMNVTRLTESDLRWADIVFISAMVVQQDSVRSLLDRCKSAGVKTVGGGPLLRPGYEDLAFDDVDYVVAGEAENVLPQFLEDLAAGCASRVYLSDERPDITTSPSPMWSLVDMRHYQLMSVQYSRGCPFNCEFCDIILMNGHVPRTKGCEQVLAELNGLYDHGWRGAVFFTDDNFIGNKSKLKRDILPAIMEWNRTRDFPFTFITEASINLSDDDELMQMMVDAGFDMVFVGIESPNEESLVECNKLPNKGRDLLAAVRTIQSRGLQVQGGFIVGFDQDPPSIFQRQIDFIQKSGIVTAMVGVLMAPPGTALYKRMQAEGRLLRGGTGNNTDGSTNLIPRMGIQRLNEGYKQVVSTIYSPRPYYERIRTFLQQYNPRPNHRSDYSPRYILALLRCMWAVGVRQRGRADFWRLYAWTLRHKPRSFHLFITFAIQGYHYRKVAEHIYGRGGGCAAA